MEGPTTAPTTFHAAPSSPLASRVTTSSITGAIPRRGGANSFTPLSNASLYSSRSSFHCARLSDNDVTGKRPNSSPRPRNSCHLAAEPSSVTQGTGDKRLASGSEAITSSIFAAKEPAISSRASSLMEPAAWRVLPRAMNRSISGRNSALPATPTPARNNLEPMVNALSMTTGSETMPRTTCCHIGLSWNSSYEATKPSVNSVGASISPKSPRTNAGN